MDLIQRFDQVFALDPAALAVGQGAHWYSYAELASFVDALAAIVDQAGAGPGTPVGILLRNRPAHFAAALGVIWRGHCVVTVNPMLPDQPLAEDVEALRIPILIADREDWAKAGFLDAARRAGAIGVQIETLPEGLTIGLHPELQSAGKGPHRPPDPQTAVEMLTSGTTGKPKRIKLDVDSLSRALWTGSKYEAGSDGELKLKSSPTVQWMPLVHIGGLFQALYSVYNARRFTLMERFDLGAWHDLIVEYRPRFANLPPSFLKQLLDRDWPKADFESLLVVRTGAAPLDHDLALEFERRYGIPVLEAYGATEFAGGVAGWNIRDYRKYGASKRRSVGRANIGVELQVVDRETFAPLEANQEGILEVRSKQMDDGKSWIRTTDLARLDEDGFLYILGRSDNAIIRGGFKVLPGTVEAALRSHDAVRDACVVAIPDDKVGQVPAAAIQLRDDAAPPGEEAMRDFLRSRLKAYEIPAKFAFVLELPRTPSLKVSQADVRYLFAQTASDAD
jgi:acyl-CoA synthetase (AMP-forming)/AMP-acid ligase II